MKTLYDDVRYPGRPYPQTHPDSLAVPARLLGLEPAPIDRCRVLEIGCGEGSNLIPQAVSRPEAAFVGFDIADGPVAEGRAAIAALGLRNARLEVLDIADADPGELGEFDYVVAHGVYSWVPDPVRDRMMALIAQVLAPHGVAYVSYAALPGCRIRQILRGLLQYHLAEIEDPRARFEQAPLLLRTLLGQLDDNEVRVAALKEECAGTLERPMSVVFHDEMAPFYHPVHFHEFDADAQRHGLRWFAEADPQEFYRQLYPSPAEETAMRLAGGDLHAFQQYNDFVRMRMFRQSLLCRADAPVKTNPDSQKLRGLRVSSTLRADHVTPPAGDVVKYVTGNDQSVSTGSPALKAAFARLEQAFPASAPFEELGDDPDLPGAFLRLYAGALVQVHSGADAFVSGVSERPRASPWARRQAEADLPLITNQRHFGVVLDPEGRRFVALLDGERDRSALAAAWADQAPAGPASIEAKVSENLEKVARLALLVG